MDIETNPNQEFERVRKEYAMWITTDTLDSVLSVLKMAVPVLAVLIGIDLAL